MCTKRKTTYLFVVLQHTTYIYDVFVNLNYALLKSYKVGDPNSVRQQLRFRVVAKERSKHSRMWPDRASLDDGP